MAFFSNGQSKSSHSPHSSSGGSDSEDQRFYARFYAKINRSGRQHSSSPSASSSDYEQEEVSTRPAAEKPSAPPFLKKSAAPPSLNKNPNSKDRYVVRNQSTLLEPNPNIPSASKAKKGVAAKRAKDDDFVEEQLEPKKKSVSKAKKHAEDDEGQPYRKKKSASKGKKAAGEDNDAEGGQTETKKKSVFKGNKAVKDDGAAEEQAEPKNKLDEPKKKWVSKGNKPVEEEVPASNPTEKKPRKRQEQYLDHITAGGSQVTAREDQTSAGDQISSGKDHTSAGDRGARAQMLEEKDHTSAGDLGARGQMLEEKWRELEIFETEARMMRYALLHEKCALHLESPKAPRVESRKRGNARSLSSHPLPTS